METNETYADALDSLAAYKPMGPGYIILGGGAGGGAVITKKLIEKSDVALLDDALANGSYYVVQTPAAAPWPRRASGSLPARRNYDRDGPPPAFDDRRYPIVDCLDNHASGAPSVSRGMLFEIMSANPTRNALTTFTMLMSPSNGTFEVYKQKCDPGPHCSPF